MTASMYANFAKHLITGDVDIDTATFKAMLCDATYTADDGAHEFRSSVTGEMSGTGYTAGGVALTSLAVSVDTGARHVKLDAADADFGTVTLADAAQLVVYVDTGSAATDILVSNHVFAAPVSPDDVNLTYQFNADGIGYFSY